MNIANYFILKAKGCLTITALDGDGNVAIKCTKFDCDTGVLMAPEVQLVSIPTTQKERDDLAAQIQTMQDQLLAIDAFITDITSAAGAGGKL